MNKPKYLKWKILLCFLYALALVLWTWLELPCIPRFITGVICPGCGMSRAWLAMLRLNVAAAFSYHPMFWSVPLLVLYVLYDGQLFRNKWVNGGVLWLMVGGFALSYIIRLIVYFGGNLTI